MCIRVRIQPPVQKATTPRSAGVYRMAEGTLDRSAATPRGGPAVIFNNMTLSGYYSVPGANQEWIDEGGLLDRNTSLSDQINGFDFVYCSTEPDPTQNSGTITITFYDDTVRCAGPPTWPTNNCAYDVIGLPLGGATGNIQCWIVSVDLQFGFECPPNHSFPDFRTEEMGVVDRLFGWGFIPWQNNTGPWLAKGGYRRDNSFTWFDPTTGAFIGCFWFGGFPFANFAMRLYGNPVDMHYLNPSNPVGQFNPPNPLAMDSDDEVLAGGTITITMVAGWDPAKWYWLLASTDCRTPGLQLGANGELIIDHTTLLSMAPMPTQTTTYTVPPRVRGFTIYLQSICLDNTNPPAANNVGPLSNALCFLVK